MTEETHKNWDTVTKIAGPVLTSLTIFVGFWQFNESQKESRALEVRTHRIEAAVRAENATLEFRRRIWEQQLKTYSETAAVAGEVAASADQPAKFEAAVARFNKLYWGDMILVEGNAIREKMIAFHTEIRDVRAGIYTKAHGIRNLNIRANELNEEIRAFYNGLLDGAPARPQKTNEPQNTGNL